MDEFVTSDMTNDLTTARKRTKALTGDDPGDRCSKQLFSRTKSVIYHTRVVGPFYRVSVCPVRVTHTNCSLIRIKHRLRQ